MSWGGLPWWVYEVEYELTLAKMTCAFEEELNSGTSKHLPDHVIDMHPATFRSWEPEGWNYGKE
jgi:hypothetical protein